MFKKLAGRTIFILGIVFFGFATYLAIDGLNSRPQSADVVIVFGSMVNPSGAPSARLKARLDHALQLYKSNMAPAIIVSGGTGKEGFDESLVMKFYLVVNGVPEMVITADGQGNNTSLSCQNAARIMAAKEWHRADVVSQYFHISRVKLTCRRSGINVVGASAPRYFELRDLYFLVREMMALPVYYLENK